MMKNIFSSHNYGEKGNKVVSMSRSRLATGSLIVAVMGITLGYGAAIQTSDLREVNAFPIRASTESYQFIKPLIGFEVGDKKEFDEYKPLEQKISSIIKTYEDEGKASSISVYFRNVDSGRWTGVNEDDQYAPASLYKVALMIAYLKQVESHPEVLDRMILFSASRQTEKPDYPPMTIGKAYSTMELIRRLIVYSDNDARDLLHDHINQHSVNDVFSDLGLEVPAGDDTGNSMSAKSYSRFFRTLYSATYLSQKMSELALTMLSQVEFKDGLVAGLPQSIPIAHKYGYRVLSENGNSANYQLHDCGIVYEPEHPYFLCVMSKGENPGELKKVIQEISKLVYEEVKT